MARRFDRRVLPEPVIALVRACQRRVPNRLGGGAALSGAWLSHRLSRDVDLFFDQAEQMRELVANLPAVSSECGVPIAIVRDAGSFIRARLGEGDESLELDLVHEATAPVDSSRPLVEGVLLESLADLRSAKLTCLLSRSEPRDLVDLLFLDRAGYAPERDLELALRKDAGIDPAILAWLLRQFPLQPLPVMLEPLTAAEFVAFRDELAERMRRIVSPPVPD